MNILHRINLIDLILALIFTVVGIFFITSSFNPDNFVLFLIIVLSFFSVGLFVRITSVSGAEWVRRNNYANSYKPIGIILLVLAGIVFIGLLSHWTFGSWQIVDWMVIITCGLVGLFLLADKRE